MNTFTFSSVMAVFVLGSWLASTCRDEIGGLLRDHERGRIGVGRGDRRKNRGVDDAALRASTLRARTHPASADRVVDRRGACPKVGDEIRIAHAQQIGRERLAYEALNRARAGDR